MSEEQKSYTPQASPSKITVCLGEFGRLCVEAARVPQLEADLLFAMQGLRQAAEEQERAQFRIDGLVKTLSEQAAVIAQQEQRKPKARIRRKPL